MKKLGLTIAVAAAMGATSVGVQAYTMGNFDHGLLVPLAYYNSASETTAVGLTSCAKGNIHWTWFDVNSNPQVDDVIPVTKDDMVSFVVAQNIGTKFQGQPGYLVFVLDTNGAGGQTNGPDQDLDRSEDEPCLAGNALYVDVPNQDVMFTPTTPIEYWDINDGRGWEGLRDLDNTFITELDAGAQRDEWMYMRYAVDHVPANGNDTNIYLWTVCKPPGLNHDLMFDADQDAVSLSFELPNDELNILDVEEIATAAVDPPTDGFITWQVAAASSDGSDPAYCDFRPGRGRMQFGGAVIESDNETACASEVGDVDAERRCWRQHQAAVAFSEVKAIAFGAVQSLLANHGWTDEPTPK